MKRIKEEESFRTSDLYLAAYLCASRGLSLSSVDSSRDPNRVVFLLVPRPDPADVTGYTEGKALVEVGAFGRALRTLKRELHRVKRGRRP